MNPPYASSLKDRLGKIGLGCATFGREIGEAESFTMMDHARARGITQFDTAAAYAGGESERIVGAWLASRRPEPGAILLATKMLAPFTPDAIQASVDKSLRLLRVAAIDLFYFHKWDEGAADPRALAALDRLVREGKIRALGAANFSAEQLERVMQLQAQAGYARIAALQNNQNFAVRHIDEPLRRLCAREDVALVAFSPLGSGFLTGKHRQGVEPGSRFALVPANQRIYFTEESMRRLDRLEAVAARTGHSLVALALSWALHQPGIASVLAGGRKPAHLDQAFAALAVDYPEIWRELETA